MRAGLRNQLASKLVSTVCLVVHVCVLQQLLCANLACVTRLAPGMFWPMQTSGSSALADVASLGHQASCCDGQHWDAQHMPCCSASAYRPSRARLALVPEGRRHVHALCHQASPSVEGVLCGCLLALYTCIHAELPVALHVFACLIFYYCSPGYLQGVCVQLPRVSQWRCVWCRPLPRVLLSGPCGPSCALHQRC